MGTKFTSLRRISALQEESVASNVLDVHVCAGTHAMAEVEKSV
jgi:hypothetical protein